MKTSHLMSLTTFLPCLILMRSSDVAGQGHLKPFSKLGN